MIASTQTLIGTYTSWMEEKIDEGWDAYILTCMFEQIPGSPSRLAKVMEHDLMRVYARFVTRVVRKPLSISHAHRMPIWILLPDFPVPKRSKRNLRDVTVNDGRHLQGFALQPPGTRLSEDLDKHFFAHGEFYTRAPHPLHRIEAKRITESPDRVVDYLFKSMKRGRVTSDDIIILPRSRHELKSRVQA